MYSLLHAGVMGAWWHRQKSDVFSVISLYTADEAFLTGAGAEAIAVTKVDGRVIGGGIPGPVTQKLIKAFRKLVAKDAPED